MIDDHWAAAEKLFTLLELFYDSIVALSGTYYPTSLLILHHLIQIVSHLKNYENGRYFRHVVVPIKDKYLN